MRRYLHLVLKRHLPILETGVGLDNGIDWGCKAQKRRRELLPGGSRSKPPVGGGSTGAEL